MTLSSDVLKAVSAAVEGNLKDSKTGDLAESSMGHACLFLVGLLTRAFLRSVAGRVLPYIPCTTSLSVIMRYNISKGKVHTLIQLRE